MTQKTDPGTKNGLKRGELSAFARKAKVSTGFAFAVLTGNKRVTLERAGKLFHRTGRKFGALEHANDRDAAAVVRVLKQSGELDA